MPKGKKFDAAEKHFEKKCVEWRKRISELEQANKVLNQKLCDNINEIERLQMENEYLKQQNKALMELKDMSVADVKTLVESRESMRNASSLLMAMMRIPNNFH